ncbi:MAG: hypothetical protein QHH26_00680 [Armatimonadota bacterium]|nr:hypothetical protein [Armatimonadota bacterium]
MRLVLLLFVLLGLLSQFATGAPKEPIYGVGYVSVYPENHPLAKAGELEAALEIADRCREAGLNHVNLVGPLLFYDSDVDSRIEALVSKLHEKGLTVSYCINTFLDKQKRNKELAWRDCKGNPYGEEYFCMAASRATRVPQIKRCIEKGIQLGFDGVLLNFFDWGTENDRICFCDTCVREFCDSIGKKFTRDELAIKILYDESIVSAWWDRKMKIRTNIAEELVKFAREVASKNKRNFWVGQCAGRAGTEPEYCGAIFDIHAPALFGSRVAGTLESYEEITRACQSWKRRVPEKSKVVALLNCGLGSPPPQDVPADELMELAQAAIKGGADGWLFVPADKLSGDDWNTLAKCVSGNLR